MSTPNPDNRGHGPRRPVSRRTKVDPRKADPRRIPDDEPPTRQGDRGTPSTLVDASPAGTPTILESLAASGSAPRYELGEELGVGATGLVLSATDPHLRRDLALKMLHEVREGSTDARTRFIEEAQITGQLQHPNIVPVYELGADASGHLYLAMKRVHGSSLVHVIREAHERSSRHAGRRGIKSMLAISGLRRLLEILLKICDAVAYAHSRSVIHRDLKPGNVMVGEFGEVLVVDWGLARPVTPKPQAQSGTRESTSSDWRGRANKRRSRDSSSQVVVTDRRSSGTGEPLTLQGEIMGTPGFMAPEQALGMINELDEGVDIYALGAILYTMMTVEPPTDVVNGDPHGGNTDILQASDLAPPGWAPPEVAAIAHKALSRRRRDRYATVADFRTDVQNFLDGDAIGAADYSSWQLLTRWAARHRTAVIGAAATFVAVIAGVIGMLMVMHQADLTRVRVEAESGQREQWLLEKAAARDREAAARDREAALRDALAQGHMEELRGLLGVRAEEKRDAAVQEFTDAFESANNDSGLTPERWIASLSPGRVDRYLEAFAYSIEASHAAGTEESSGQSHFYLGLLEHYGCRDAKAALAHFNRAVELHPTGGGPALLINRGCVREELSDIAGALADYTKAIDKAPGYAIAFNNRGVLRTHTGDLAGAQQDLDRAIQLAPEMAQAWASRGTLRRHQQDYQGALADFDKALGFAPNLVEALGNRGSLRAKVGNFSGAIADLGKAIDLAPDSWELHYNQACTYSLLAAALKRGERPRRTDHNPAAVQDRAVRSLERAGHNGFTRWHMAASDPDFISIRAHPEYRELLRRHGISPQ